MALPSFPSTRRRTDRRPSLPGLPAFGRARGFIRSLPPSDQFIAFALMLLVAVACVVSLFTLARSFQVVVPAYGGALDEGVVGAPRFVNPLLAISDTDRDLVALTYAGLMGRNADGSLIPVLAESYTISEDGTTYTFTLREAATFSDGTSVTADDVVYTVQKAQDPGLKSPVRASWANIRAEAVDARTVRFTLPKAYAPFLEDTTLGILPQHIWGEVTNEEFPFSPYMTRPVAAGPFTVDSISRTGDGVIASYRLSAFREYALGRPYLSRVKLTFFETSTELRDALESGKVTSAYGIAGARVQAVPYSRIFGVFFNEAQEPLLEDANVRKALSLAIDRTALVEDVLGGYATPLAGPLPEGSGTLPIPLPDPSVRLAVAREALTNAGWEFNEAQAAWTKDETTLRMTLKTSNVPELKIVASAVQADWQALGVPTELELHDPNELMQAVIRPRAYSALLFGEVIGSEPDLYAFWASTERKDPGLNITGYADADTDALLEKVRTEHDEAQVAAALGEAQERIAREYPAAFLYTPDFLYAMPASLSGVALTRIGSPSDRFRGVSGWYRYREHVWPWFTGRSPGKS